MIICRLRRRNRKIVRINPVSIPTSNSDLVEEWQAADGTRVRIRPIRVEDLEIERAFISGLSEEARRFRFMGGFSEMPLKILQRLTTIDYCHEMALIAVIGVPGAETEIGVARYVTDLSGEGCEFALVVADAYRRRGIATKLMQKLMRYARNAGVKTMHGEVSANNHPMLELMRILGFAITACGGDSSLMQVSKKL